MKTLMVIGATGNVGSATVKELSARADPSTTIIKAGVRDPAKAKELAELPCVEVVKAEMGADGLESVLEGVDCLFIISPGVADRAVLTLKTAASAKKAGVKHILQLSVLTVELESIFGSKQFGHIEKGIKALGVPYTIIRLPLFMENYFAFQGPISSEGKIYSCVDPTKLYTPVAVGDVAKAAATIMMDPSKHIGACYNILSDRHSFGDVATAFSQALGKEVTYVRVPYSAAKEAFMGMGFPEWMTDGIMQLYHFIDEENPVYGVEIGDFEAITGEKPTDLTSFVKAIASAFK